MRLISFDGIRLCVCRSADSLRAARAQRKAAEHLLEIARAAPADLPVPSRFLCHGLSTFAWACVLAGDYVGWRAAGGKPDKSIPTLLAEWNTMTLGAANANRSSYPACHFDAWAKRLGMDRFSPHLYGGGEFLGWAFEEEEDDE